MSRDIVDHFSSSHSNAFTLNSIYIYIYWAFKYDKPQLFSKSQINPGHKSDKSIQFGFYLNQKTAKRTEKKNKKIINVAHLFHCLYDRCLTSPFCRLSFVPHNIRMLSSVNPVWPTVISYTKLDWLIVDVRAWCYPNRCIISNDVPSLSG